jgi:hypothetical protein
VAVEVGPWNADEGVEQAPEFGHGQRDELAGSGSEACFSAVTRVPVRSAWASIARVMCRYRAV